MGSGGESDGLDDDFDEDDLGLGDSQRSQVLPGPQKNSRSTKRRRTSDDSPDDDDSIDDFIDDSDDTVKPAKRSRTSRNDQSEHGSADEDEEQAALKKKKSKYKIHIPRDHKIPETTIQYGTQLPENPDSSPYRIRGAKWKLPRKVAEAPTISKPPNWTRDAVLSVVNPDDLNDLNNDPAITGSLRREQPQARKHVSRSSVGDENHFGSPPAQPPPVDISEELADLPSDAFSSSPEPAPSLPSRSFESQSQVQQRLVAPHIGLRQTTLFGGRAPEAEPPPSQVNKVHNYRVDMVPEAPTHHKLDQEALKTWVYPTNLGAVRDYQFNIVRNGLFHNMLVALPTGLGKTFIAATIMLNYFRWTKDAKIVFMAPTKPLVSQQVDACFNIAGMPRSTTTMLTGEITPAVRAEEWEEKRVFFMTPQTLDNDLRTGIADPKKIVLLVIDEAHRATGNYSYVKVVSFMRRFSKSFRILALTATPGSSVEAVQEVIDGLEIAKVEIRTEESMDLQQFTHRRKIDQILLDPSDEIIMAKDLFSKALQPLVDKLCGQNAYWNKDPMSLTSYGLVQAQKSWFLSEAGRRANHGLKNMMYGLFSILGSVAHGIKLLNYHGIGPFYGVVKEFRSAVEERGEKGGKYRRQISDSPHFQKLMDRLQTWINKEDFVGHPKLTYLCDTVLNHFLDAGEGRLPDGAPPSSTRVIVFAEYRDSAEEISRVLNRHGPMIRSSVFVGQADSKRSAGMSQKEQLETIRKFKTGAFNVLVATSIGEEGLDIGQVDLIVCYDASGSPIRMLQRMGRTGRKRAGNIVLLLMRGKEEESFAKAKDGYEQMQKMISSGTRFSYHHDLSTRIIPKDFSPVVEKRHVEIPVENTQDTSLPEPKRRPSKARKKPAKKFHMPDGVETGFRKASKLAEQNVDSEDNDVAPLETSIEQLMPIPDLQRVLLDSDEMKDLEQSYQSVTGDDLQEVSIPEMNSQPEFQRALGPWKFVPHGHATKRFISTIIAMRSMDEFTTDGWRHVYEEHGMGFLDDPCDALSSASSPTSSFAFLEPEPKAKTPARKTLSTKAGKAPRRKSIPPNTADESETSRSSEDEDPEDFVVRDNEPLRRKISASTLSSSPPAFSPPKSKPFFVPTQFTATQDTNDDEEAMPDLGDLLGNTPRQSSPSVKKNKRSVDTSGSLKVQRGKKRRIVEDSDE